MHRYRFEYANTSHGKDFKVNCPSCGGKKTFNRFYDNELGGLSSPEFGKCDRINKCGYINRPEGRVSSRRTRGVSKVSPPKPPSYFSKTEVRISLKHKHKDVLSLFLIKHYGDKAKQVLKDYAVASVFKFEHWVPMFWFIDDKGGVRSAKVMNFDIEDGVPRRTHYPNQWHNFEWLHTSRPNFNYKQIAFGSHLLKKYPDKEVHIVESEKTALIMACVKPEHIWLATLSATCLQEHLLPDLRDRKVVVHPDKGPKTFQVWQEKIEYFVEKGLVKSGNCSIFVEENDKLAEGDDIADYILTKIST